MKGICVHPYELPPFVLSCVISDVLTYSSNPRAADGVQVYPVRGPRQALLVLPRLVQHAPQHAARPGERDVKFLSAFTFIVTCFLIRESSTDPSNHPNPPITTNRAPIPSSWCAPPSTSFSRRRPPPRSSWRRQSSRRRRAGAFLRVVLWCAVRFWWMWFSQTRQAQPPSHATKPSQTQTTAMLETNETIPNL